MKIGIIGAGFMGKLLGSFWKDAGHEVVYGVKNTENVEGELTKTIYQTAVDADVVVLAVNFWALKEIAELIYDLDNIIIIDITNPFQLKAGTTEKLPQNFERAIPMDKTGISTLISLLPKAKLVKAFCSLAGNVLKENHKKQPRIAIGYTTDNQVICSTIELLISDAGFAPVFVGDLSKTNRIELMGELSMKIFTETEMKNSINI